MGKSAYLVFYINKETLAIDKMAIYSESNPTININKWFTIVALKQNGQDFEDAKIKLIEALKIPAYHWMQGIDGYFDLVIPLDKDDNSPLGEHQKLERKVAKLEARIKIIERNHRRLA